MIRLIKLTLLPVLLLASCEKAELVKYEEPAMIYFYKDYFNVSQMNDSTRYSFAVKPASLMSDTVRIPLRIMGAAATADREVKIEPVADSSTAIAGQHYEILPVKIKANEFTTNVHLVVKRTPDLATSEVNLMLEIKESADFRPGIPNTAPSNPHAGGNLKYKVKINDILSQPSNWNMLQTFFGTYSKVKYLFIIQCTGLSTFNYGPGGLSYAEMNFYNDKCKTDLAQYVLDNGPLLDENGVAVTFP